VTQVALGLLLLGLLVGSPATAADDDLIEVRSFKIWKAEHQEAPPPGGISPHTRFAWQLEVVNRVGGRARIDELLIDFRDAKGTVLHTTDLPRPLTLILEKDEARTFRYFSRVPNHVLQYITTMGLRRPIRVAAESRGPTPPPTMIELPSDGRIEIREKGFYGIAEVPLRVIERNRLVVRFDCGNLTLVNRPLTVAAAFTLWDGYDVPMMETDSLYGRLRSSVSLGVLPEHIPPPKLDRKGKPIPVAGMTARRLPSDGALRCNPQDLPLAAFDRITKVSLELWVAIVP
jgi:hypothetical protein